jgi:hypothetical protein
MKTEVPPMSLHDEAQSWEREERYMANDRERVAEFEAVLTNFHASIGTDIPLWRDSADAITAFAAATQLRDVYHELSLLYLQRIKRGEALRHQGREDPAPTLSPEQVQRARVNEAWERVDHELSHLRDLGVADEIVRRAERERRARLLWLIGILETVMPQHAERMRQELFGPGSAHLRLPVKTRFRRERQMGDALVLFLEPLL